MTQLLIAIILFTGILVKVTRSISTGEYQALQDIFKSTGGSGWYWPPHRSQWKFDIFQDPCAARWYGINCGSKSQIIEISLPYANLIGTLPTSVSLLTALQILNVEHNHLSGTIPIELFEMSTLKYLFLNDNSFTTIPTTLTGQISSNLKRFEAHNNALSSVLRADYFLFAIPTMEVMSLYNNELKGSLPQNIGNMTSLQQLQLQNNVLEGFLPESIGNMTRLRMFNASNNRITGGILPSFQFMASLQSLDLHNNHLTYGLPIEIGYITSLQYLDLSQNGIAGTLPATIQGLQNLKYFDISDNSFSGNVPSTFGNLQFNLDYYDLSKNAFVTSLPIPEFVALQELYDNNGGASWTLPPGAKSWQITTTQDPCTEAWYGLHCYFVNNDPNQHLASISLSGVNLRNAIPPQLGSVSKLQQLVLSSNQLTGSIPPALGQLTALAQLDLAYNQLTGCVPSAVYALPAYQVNITAGNQLTGECSD